MECLWKGCQPRRSHQRHSWNEHPQTLWGHWGPQHVPQTFGKSNHLPKLPWHRRLGQSSHPWTVRVPTHCRQQWPWHVQDPGALGVHGPRPSPCHLRFRCRWSVCQLRLEPFPSAPWPSACSKLLGGHPQANWDPKPWTASEIPVVLGCWANAQEPDHCSCGKWYHPQPHLFAMHSPPHRCPTHWHIRNPRWQWMWWILVSGWSFVTVATVVMEKSALCPTPRYQPPQSQPSAPRLQFQQANDAYKSAEQVHFGLLRQKLPVPPSWMLLATWKAARSKTISSQSLANACMIMQLSMHMNQAFMVALTTSLTAKCMTFFKLEKEAS